MGRGLKHLVSAFMPIADGQRFASPDELASLCSYAKAMLCEQKPRVHTISEPCQPVLIFTDGANENGVATAAAVVITGSSRLAYVVTVPQALVELWIKTAGDQIISQVELWALVSVRFCLRHKLQGRRIIEWIDNEAARMSAIKANSSSPSMKVLARIVWLNWSFSGQPFPGQNEFVPFPTPQTCRLVEGWKRLWWSITSTMEELLTLHMN